MRYYAPQFKAAGLKKEADEKITIALPYIKRYMIDQGAEGVDIEEVRTLLKDKHGILNVRTDKVIMLIKRTLEDWALIIEPKGM